MRELKKGGKSIKSSILQLSGNGKRVNPAAGRNLSKDGINVDDGFWTRELMAKFHKFNYHRSNKQEADQVYQQAHTETHKHLLKRKEYLQAWKIAKKAGNQLNMDIAMENAENERMLTEKAQHYGQMQIFQLKNDKFELKDYYLDLHGLHLPEAVKITSLRLRQI